MEVASTIFVTGKADPRFQLGIKVGVASKRQQPVTMVRPLEALSIKGECTLPILCPAASGHKEGAAI